MDNYEFGETIYMTKHSPSSAGKHLKGTTHNLNSSGQPAEEAGPSVHELLVTGSHHFIPEIFRLKLLCFIAVLHLPFSLVEQDEFRDMMLYTSPYLRHDDSLPKSGSTIQIGLVNYFVMCQLILISMLQDVSALIHLSFDLWMSPNHYAFLGVVCHFIDWNWKAHIVLLALLLLYRSHAGVDMAQLVIHVIMTYKLYKILGYCIMDNAPDNDTCLCEVEHWLATKGVIWGGNAHRLCCFGHVVSLIANAFTSNKPLKVACIH